MRSRLFFIIISLCCLTSCQSLSEDCKERFCWNASYEKNACGGSIVDHCEAVCDACVFNEPVCKLCMKCMDSK